jgi:hypothetical protein
MSLEAIVAKYKITDDEVSEINGLIQIEKDRADNEKKIGVEAARKKGKELLEKVTELNKFRDLLKNKFEFNPDEELEPQVDKLKEKLGKIEQGSSVPNDEIEKLRKTFTGKIESLEKVIKDEQAEKEAVKIQFKNSKTSEILTKEMSSTFLGHDLVIEKLIREGKVKLSDDNSSVFFVEDGEEIELLKGIEGLKKSRPDLVKNVQSPGSGGGITKNDLSKKKKLTLSEFNSLEPVVMAKFQADGGEVIKT